MAKRPARSALPFSQDATFDHLPVHGLVVLAGEVPGTLQSDELRMIDSLAPRAVEVNDLWPGLQRHSEYVTPALVAPEKLDLHVDPAVTRGDGLPGMFVGVKFTPEVKLDRDGSAADRVIKRLEEGQTAISPCRAVSRP